MVKQEKDYLKQQKKKYLRYTIYWTIGVLAVFVIGIAITGERANYFTLASGLLVVGLALHFSRFMAYRKFKDGDEDYSNYLEGMKGDYNIIHSAVIPDVRATLLVEHIVVTSRNIYFLCYNEQMLKHNRLALENRLLAKGISLKAIQFVKVDTMNALKNIALKIEKDAYFASEALEEKTQIVQELLM